MHGLSIRLIVLLLVVLTAGCAHQVRDTPPDRGAMAAMSSAHDAPDFTTGDYMTHADRHLAPIYAETPLEIYCGCDVDFDTKQIDIEACGYQPQTPGVDNNTKLHWEHVFPKSWVAKALPCGTSAACKADARWSKIYKTAENDLYNLVPSVGSLNVKRNDNWLWEVPGERREFGRCDFEVARLEGETLIEPPNRNKGNVARIILYYIEQHGLDIPDEAMTLYLEWHEQDPVDAKELKRAQAIEAVIGRANPWVAGER